MAAPKGHKFAIGRPKGIPNKVTQDLRQFFADFLDRNVAKMDELFERTAKEDPAKALGLVADFSEYCIPKLSRTELTGKDEGELHITLNLPPSPDHKPKEK